MSDLIEYIPLVFFFYFVVVAAVVAVAAAGGRIFALFCFFC